MEGMKFKSFNGEVEMRKTDHQLQQALFITKWQKAAASAERLQRREHRLHLRSRSSSYEPYVSSTPDHLPDEAARRDALSAGASPSRARRQRAAAGPFVCAPASQASRCDHGFFIITLLNGLSYGLLLFMLQLGPDADLQHDGRAELRARQLLHARARTSPTRSPASSASGPRCSLAPLLVGVLGALFERYWPAHGAQVRPCARAADHLRPVLRDPGAGPAGLGPHRCLRRRAAAGPAFTIVQSPDGLASSGRGACRALRTADVSARASRDAPS